MIIHKPGILSFTHVPGEFSRLAFKIISANFKPYHVTSPFREGRVSLS